MFPPGYKDEDPCLTFPLWPSVKGEIYSAMCGIWEQTPLWTLTLCLEKLEPQCVPPVGELSLRDIWGWRWGPKSANQGSNFLLFNLSIYCTNLVPRELSKRVSEEYVFNKVFSFPRAARRRHHQLCGLKQQKCILLWFWRLEVWNKDVDRAMIPLRILGKSSLPSSKLWEASLGDHLQGSSFFYVCVAAHVCLLIRTPVILC